MMAIYDTFRSPSHMRLEELRMIDMLRSKLLKSVVIRVMVLLSSMLYSVIICYSSIKGGNIYRNPLSLGFG